MEQSDVDALLDISGLLGGVDQLRDEYVNARPWPHLVLRGIFASGALQSAKRECLGVTPAEMYRTVDWRQLKEETATPPGPFTETILRTLESDSFVAFLESLTGITNLVADPTRTQAGVHRTPRGGFTMVHRDFRRHPHTSLYHRVNVLLYVNESWQERFGGYLELWPSNMSGEPTRIAPESNTLVIWETHDQTLHGLPDPIACPDGDARVALASYYYTREPRTVRVKRRGPTYARRPGDSWTVGRRTPRDIGRSIGRRIRKLH